MPINPPTPHSDSRDLPPEGEDASTPPFGHRNLNGLADEPDERSLEHLHFLNNQMIARYRLIYSLCALALGFVCILGGIVLFLGGVTGATSWTAKVLGAESNVTDAAPGAILFIVGLFLVVTTRFKHRTRGSQ